MSKLVAVIDIGSNSARLVIYELLNSELFSIHYEEKIKVQIGEGSYNREGYLQPDSIKRAYLALQTFKRTIQNYPISSTLAVATSAVRDAPNRDLFIQLIKKDLNLDIKVIDGDREAVLGATAAIKLLSVKDGITIDIGGGSSDLALIEDFEIVDSCSLNLGTVRLKELFSKKNRNVDSIKKFINSEISSLPSHFKRDIAIGIGGTARTLSKTIMRREDIKLSSIHNFKYSIKAYDDFFQEIIYAEDSHLKELKISKNRMDTIREGTLIWKTILERIEAKEVIGSAVGIREGLYLESQNLTESKSSVRFIGLT